MIAEPALDEEDPVEVLLASRVGRLWVIAAFGNLAGAFLGYAVHVSQSYSPAFEELLGEIVDAKMRYRDVGGVDGWLRAVLSGVLGNWLVGMAAFMAVMGRTIIGKYIPVLLTVSAFVAAGFMRSPANMAFFSLATPEGLGPGGVRRSCGASRQQRWATSSARSSSWHCRSGWSTSGATDDDLSEWWVEYIGFPIHPARTGRPPLEDQMTDYRSPLEPRTLDTAEGDAATRLAATHEALGMVPNMYAVMANSPGLLATYLDGYQWFRSASGFTPGEQEAVFLTISRFNECDYCMAAHSFIADNMSKTPIEVTDAIRDDRPIDDERFAALVGVVRSLLETRGHPAEADVAAFREAGFTDQQVLELVLAIAAKTISNWSNHLFGTQVDDAFASRTWSVPEPV